MRVHLFGNLTIDHNLIEAGKFTGPGGSVYFCARTLQNLSVSSTIVSAYGADFPKQYLTKTRFYPEKPNVGKTLVFRNIYQPRRIRKQWVQNYEEAGLGNLINSFVERGDRIEAVLVAPILPNINFSDLVKIKVKYSKSFRCLLPQGFFRTIGKNGKIYTGKFKKAAKIVSLFNVIIFSDKDTSNADLHAQKWSSMGPMVIVTKEEKGCSLFSRGRREDVPAFKIKKTIDSTGAGDVFAAAYTFAFIKSMKPTQASQFANATAALSLRFKPNRLQYGYSDILAFARQQGRNIAL